MLARDGEACAFPSVHVPNLSALITFAWPPRGFGPTARPVFQKDSDVQFSMLISTSSPTYGQPATCRPTHQSLTPATTSSVTAASNHAKETPTTPTLSTTWRLTLLDLPGRRFHPGRNGGRPSERERRPPARHLSIARVFLRLSTEYRRKCCRLI